MLYFEETIAENIKKGREFLEKNIFYIKNKK